MWRWADPEETIATNDDGVFAPAGAAQLADVEIAAYRRFATLAEAKLARIEEVRSKTRSLIVAGFSSAALGTPHVYPSNETDQQNLAANILSAMLPGVSEGWTTLQLCADAAGVWTYRAHTQAQIVAVGIDAKTRVMACLLNGASLQAAIAGVAVADGENDDVPAIARVEAININAGWPS